MRQRSPQSVQFPDNQAVAGLDESERLGQTRSISTAAADPIFKQVTLIDTGSDEGVTLQVQHLAVAIRRDAHVADQHVRKTSFSEFPHSASFRQGLSHIFCPPIGRPSGPLWQ
jgi:hypothetical protein